MEIEGGNPKHPKLVSTYPVRPETVLGHAP